MIRRKTDAQNPQDWFDLALERLRAADVLWIHEQVTASGVELLQEGVERLLKEGLQLNQASGLPGLPSSV